MARTGACTALPEVCADVHHQPTWPGQKDQSIEASLRSLSASSSRDPQPVTSKVHDLTKNAKSCAILASLLKQAQTSLLLLGSTPMPWLHLHVQRCLWITASPQDMKASLKTYRAASKRWCLHCRASSRTAGMHGTIDHFHPEAAWQLLGHRCLNKVHGT